MPIMPKNKIDNKTELDNTIKPELIEPNNHNNQENGKKNNIVKIEKFSEFERYPEGEEIIEALITNYPDHFSNFETSKIICFFKSKSAKYAAKIFVTKDEIRLLTNCFYYIVIPKKKWQEYNKAKKHLILFHELKHIPIDKFGSKLKKHNIEDFECILSKFGVNWQLDLHLMDILEQHADIPVH